LWRAQWPALPDTPTSRVHPEPKCW